MACIGMSVFGGLTNRIAYSPSRWALLRDVAAAAALENNLILVAQESVIAIPYMYQPARRRPNNTQKQIRGRSSSLSGYGVMLASKRIVHRGLVGILCVVWIVASWGDYVFESESRGLIPTMWVIAPGLKDPSVHAGVQMRNHRDVFVGGLVRCVLGLCIGLGYALIVHRYCSRPYSRDGHAYQWTMHICASFHHSRFLFDTLKTPKMLGWNIAALVTFFWLGAWAPLTNLICCILGIFLLTPPGGAIGNNEAVLLPTIRGSSHNGSSKRQRRAVPPPNVIVIVHESLSGAAMQSARGIDAAPFFHSMRSSPDFYDFRFARTTAGTTPIATPSLLTGLMPYDEQGVELVKRASLATDFKRLGYDTSCFAAYGSDWTGNAWEILNHMLMPGFDAVFDPKATGDALVNEYGMDDRALSNHFRQWLKTRRAPGNITASDVTEPNDGDGDKNPFFSLIVQNNNHFPHLMHESYSGGDPDCEKKRKEDGESRSQRTTIAAEAREQDSLALGSDAAEDLLEEDDVYDEDFGWDGDYGGDASSCGFSDVSRYFSSIRTIDEALKTIFDSLRESGKLNNTIIMGAGDHGEVPGVLERMDDVNAPILSVPLWMYVPERLLPDRAYMRTGENGRRSADNTYLRVNVDRGVSILDMVPTLRDLVGFDDVYSSEEIEKCGVGQSLLSQESSPKRIMMSWQGLPLQGHQIGIFSTASEALLYYKKDPSQTKQVDYIFPPEDLFFNRSEHPLNEEPAIGQKWKLRLQKVGLLDSAAVKKWMPNLEQVLDRPMAKEESDGHVMA